VNWRSSLTGALLVAAAGLGVGIAIGGKKTTRIATRTVTVVHREVASLPATTSTPTSTSTSTSGTSTSPPGTTATTSSTTTSSAASGGSKQYYANYLSTQDTTQLDSNATHAGLDGNASSLELKGQTYPQAVAFDLSTDGHTPQTESYQLPIPGFTHFSASIAGLATNDSANSSYKLTIYKNNDNPGATVLYTDTFNGPSGTHAIGFDTQGATDLVLDWTEPTSGEPDYSDQFILANPVVSS
jgi:hypothetical protein